MPQWINSCRRMPNRRRHSYLIAMPFIAAIVSALASSAGCGSHVESEPATASIGGGQPSAQDPFASSNAARKAAADRSHPEVQLHTSRGDITLRLDAEQAPITVINFLTYIDKGQYDNVIFHQIDPGVAILGGGYDTFSKEKPAGTPIRNEAHNGLKNRRGTIAMNRRPDSIDSSTCQFFINLADNPRLDYRVPPEKVVDFRSVKGPRDFKNPDASQYGYCVFGEVVEGMDVVDAIGRVQLHDSEKFMSTPVEPVILKWAHVVR